MVTLLDYATLSAMVYNDVRRTENKLLPNPPTGWVQILADSNPGFTAGAFQNGNDIVIAFKGSDVPALNANGVADWIFTNAQAGLGFGSSQLMDAVLFYEAVKAANPGANITFTGHSLGGGLASLMSVYFNKPATTFAEAPFLMTAVNPLITGYVGLNLALNGIVDSDFAGFVGSMPLSVGLRASNVQDYFVNGEALSYWRGPLSAIYGSDTPIEIGGGNSVSSIDLHSIVLTSALLMQDKLRADTIVLPSLLTELFDKQLYARDLNSPQRDFLNTLLNDQVRVGYTDANGLLARFSTDIDKLTQLGDNLKTGELGKAVIDVAIADYYFMQSGFSGKDFFSAITGGISLDLKDIGADWSSNRAVARLDNAVITQLLNGDQSARSILAQDNYWSIQSGNTALDATGTGTNNDAMIGGTGSDTLNGMDGNDFLFGGAGDDFLIGGAGSNLLEGGAGNDVYYVGSGTNRIYDSNGHGIIYTGSGQLSGGSGDGFTYKSLDGAHTYALIGDMNNADGAILVVDGSLTIQHYHQNDLGITLDAAASTITPTLPTITGDFAPIVYGTDAQGNPLYHLDALGNRIVDTNQPGAVDDILNGSSGNDSILTGMGRDYANGKAGDDLMQGGTGSDILAGEDGNDRLYGDSQISTEQAITNGNSDIATGLQGDWLAGGAGDDTLVAGTDNDVLSGGGGNDLIVAGAGDDYIVGDADYTAQNLNWSIAVDANGNAVFTPATDATNPADAGNDIIYAGEGNDHVWADGGNDVVYGEGGNDTINGEAGNDILLGGSGNDVIFGDGNAANTGDDYLDGGDGNDTLWGGNGNDTLLGGAGSDKLYGETGANYLDGGDGNDVLNSGGPGSNLQGGAGDDNLSSVDAGNYLDGADGNDTLAANGSSNELYGGAGDDNLYASGDSNYLDGEAGSNTLQAVGNNNELFGGSGADDIAAWGGGNYLDGGDGSNTLYAQGANNEIHAGSGNDHIQAIGSNNYVDAGEGNNSVVTSGGNATLFAGAGDDTLSAAGGGSYLDGGNGSNILVADGGGNTLVAGAGNDTLSATGGGNTLAAGAGNDTLIADGAGNTLLGGAGDDSLQGGSGNDSLEGDSGNDTLAGGAGNDVYVFNRSDGQDVIDNTDLLNATDTLRFGAGIADTDVIAMQAGADLCLKITRTDDKIVIANYYGANSVNGDAVSDHKIDRVEFSNGVVWDPATLQIMVDRATNNHAPATTSALPVLEIRAANSFTYTVPVNAITDPDTWDSIAYSVAMSDGSALPAWLNFDAATRTFSGKPDATEVGSMQLILSATDNYGATVSESMTLNVTLNHAPVLTTPLRDQVVANGVLSYTVPAMAFADPDVGDTLSYVATLADGSALPNWLNFDPATLTFSGNPVSMGTTSVRVTATDAGNLNTSDAFDIVVTAQNLAINGTAGNDTLNGGLANDVLVGLAGNDVLNGQAGDDTLDGGPAWTSCAAAWAMILMWWTALRISLRKI
ncbi:MAG: putative Ig domain-containing protein [Nitrosomonadales bacterium]|nr:putative Ig domain-containing protein [Nitrosomonadales bacterium]